jgi:Ca-activated chloride channel homolog
VNAFLPSFFKAWFENPFTVLLAIITTVMLTYRLRRIAVSYTVGLRPWPGIARVVPDHRIRHACGVLFLAFALIAVAGSRLGSPQSIESAKPRDVMLVVDLSRSMLAEQPSRIEKASRALRNLADTLEKSGEARGGMIIFASKAELAFPLTTDIGHLRQFIDRLKDLPPPSVDSEANFESGTRIGAALKMAVAAVAGDKGSQIVLLSDGDDPIDDEEWQAGITAARTAGIPVHTVTVGEPGVDATIPWRGGVLRYDDGVVKTRVRPEPLDAIAVRTGGLSLAAAKGTLALGPALEKYWHEHPLADRETETTPTSMRSPLRAPFLLAALIAWLGTWVRLPIRWSRPLGQVVAAAALTLLIGAAPAVDDWLRRGNEAFGRGDFVEAIRCYEQARPAADDPGQVAFDLAAARFRKEEYSAAATAYRQALDDGEMPLERRRRAWFDLGNALLAEAGTSDRRLVEEAMTAYRHCLAADPELELRGDAEHNLALAGRRWLQTLPPSTEDQGTEPGNAPDKNRKTENGTGDPKNPQSTDSTGEPNGEQKSGPGVSKGGDQKTLSRGSVTHLLDATNRAPLTAADAAAILNETIGRIESARPSARSDDLPLRGKDW